MDTPLSHPLFRRYGPQQVIDDPQFDLVCPECGRPGHAMGHDPRMCILEMWRRGEVKSFNDWEPLARALGEKLRAEARAFLAAPAVVAPHVCSEASPKPTWSFTATSRHIFPPGRYYIGDLCYPSYHATGAENYYDTVFARDNYTPGLYKRSDGPRFLVGHTAYGDGSYLGSDGRRYSVDAGIIGIMDASLFDEAEFLAAYEDNPGSIRTCSKELFVEIAGGVLTATILGDFKPLLTINTAEQDEDTDYEEDKA